MLIKLGEKQFQIEFTFNSLCLIEELIGMGISEMILRQERLASLTTIRTFLYAGLNEHNPEITEREVGDLISAYIKKGGRIDSLANRLMQAMQESGLTTTQETGHQSLEKKTGPKK